VTDSHLSYRAVAELRGRGRESVRRSLDGDARSYQARGT